MKNLIYLILGFLVALLFFLLFPFNVEAVTVKTRINYSKSAPSSASKLKVTKAVKSANSTSGGLTIVEKIHKVFGEYADQAISVASCESGNFTDYIGDEGLAYLQDGIEYGKSFGPFQVRYLPGRPSPDKLINEDFNIKYAYDMFKASGWGPWTCKYVLASNN